MGTNVRFVTYRGITRAGCRTGGRGHPGDGGRPAVDGWDADHVMTATTTAVLFDLDDTLFDHRGCTRDALAEVRSRYPGAAEPLGRRDGAGVQPPARGDAPRGAGGQLTVDEARIERFRRLLAFAGDAVGRDAALAAAAYRAAYRAAWRPWRCARTACGTARAGGDRHRDEQRRRGAAAEDRRVRLRALLDAIVISEEVGVTKPDPRIFEIALRELGRPADEAVMIGNAGTSTSWRPRCRHPPDLVQPLRRASPMTASRRSGRWSRRSWCFR